MTDDRVDVNLGTAQLPALKASQSAVAPLLAGHGLPPRSDVQLRRLGLADKGDRALEWHAAIAQMHRDFPDCMPEFRALVSLRPINR